MGMGRAPSLFINMLWVNPPYFFTWIVVISFSICVHEFAHVLAASQQGDSTAVDNGFATLDPRRLMGLPSLITLALFGIAWGGVPVNPARMRHPWSHACVSAAGPGANMLLAIFGAFFLALTQRFAPDFQPLHLLFTCLLLGNCLLALLNILPIPMFDGWEVFAYFLAPLRNLSQERKNTLTWVLILILFLSPAGSWLFGTSRAIAGILSSVASRCLLQT